MKNNSSPVYIYSVGSYSPPAIDEHAETPLPVFKNILAEKIGVTIRRISRFIQIALIGAADCLQNLTKRNIDIPENTAVYLSSENGDMETTIEILDAMYRHNQPPKPLSFINSVSNAACFYIGNTFRLRGESTFISSTNLSLESALLTAYMDLKLQRIPAALVGSVDICTMPFQHHRVRTRAPENAVLGEGSHWTYLALSLANAKPLAELVAIEYVASLPMLLEKIQQYGCQGVLGLGQHLSTEDKQQLQKSYAGKVDDYSPGLPFYNSQSGYAFTHFFQDENIRELMHVNKNRQEMYCFYYLRKM